MNIQNQITKLSQEIRKAENTKLQAETRLESLEEQYRGINKQFEDMGINPKDAIKAKEQMEKEMQKLTNEINELLPHDSIKNYK